MSGAEDSSLVGHFGVLSYGAGCGLLASNIPVAVWSSLNFMTPNRHLYIVFVTLAGGVIGAALAGILVAYRGRTRIRTLDWMILAVAGFIWLMFFPSQHFGDRDGRRGKEFDNVAKSRGIHSSCERLPFISVRLWHRGEPEHYEVFRDGTFLITRGMLVVTNACNGAGGRVGFEVNASRAGLLMLHVIWHGDSYDGPRAKLRAIETRC